MIDNRPIEEIREAVAKMSKETKQDILDLLRKGKSVGEIRKQLNLPLMDVAEVIVQNISYVGFLNTEAK